MLLYGTDPLEVASPNMTDYVTVQDAKVLLDLLANGPVSVATDTRMPVSDPVPRSAPDILLNLQSTRADSWGCQECSPLATSSWLRPSNHTGCLLVTTVTTGSQQLQPAQPDGARRRALLFTLDPGTEGAAAGRCAALRADRFWVALCGAWRCAANTVSATRVVQDRVKAAVAGRRTQHGVCRSGGVV